MFKYYFSLLYVNSDLLQYFTIFVSNVLRGVGAFAGSCFVLVIAFANEINCAVFSRKMSIMVIASSIL